MFSCIWFICKWRRGGPLYRVIIIAPPILAMVPTTFAIPSLLAMLVSSSLVKRQMNSQKLQKTTATIKSYPSK